METELETKSDSGVIAALKDAVRNERAGTAGVLRCLAEFEARRLVQSTPYPNTFDYCMGELGYSRAATYNRLRAMEAAREFPQIYPLLETKRIDLSRIVTVAPHLTKDNVAELLERACTMKHRDLEFYAAGLAPKPIKRDSVRALPAAVPPPRTAATPCGPPQVPSPPLAPAAALESPANPPATPGLPAGASFPAVSPPSAFQSPGRSESAPSASSSVPAPRVEPITGQLARLSLTIDTQALADFDRACKIMGYRRSAAGVVFARAMKALLREVDPELQFARTKLSRPRGIRPGSRHVPQHVRAVVWRRDQGRCAFTDADGRRCGATTRLQLDHILPWAMGGASDDPDNIRLMCPLHNQAEARKRFGDEHIDAAIAARKSGERCGEEREERDAPG